MRSLMPSRARRAHARLIFSGFALVLCVLGLWAASAPVNAQSIELGSGYVDENRGGGAALWRREDFQPQRSGIHRIRVEWSGNANIRFSLFDSRSGNRLATTGQLASPAQWTGVLDSSRQYHLGVWADSGRATYRASIQYVQDAATEGPTAGNGAFVNPLGLSAVRSWSAGGEVRRVLTVGDNIYVGGDFTAIYGPDGTTASRTYLAAFNRFTGQPTGFAPRLDNTVWALAVSLDQRTLYVGGEFRTANGQFRPHIAAYDLQSGALLTGFNPPAPNAALRAIAVTNGKVYLGGLFNAMGNQRRPFVAAVDPRTGALDTRFQPAPSDHVKALLAGPEGLWIGGDFFQLNGRSQRGLGLVDLASGAARASDPVTANVIDLAASDRQLFVAVAGPGGRAVALNRATRREQWTIASDGDFQAVDVDDGRYVYFGGHYEIVEGDRNADRLTRHDKRTGAMDTNWLPTVNGIRSVNVIDVRPNGVYIGGDFTRIDNRPQQGFAIIPGLTQ